MIRWQRTTGAFHSIFESRRCRNGGGSAARAISRHRPCWDRRGMANERIPIMKPSTDQPKAPESKPSESAEPKPKTPEAKPGSKPDVKTDPKEDLKMLPLAEVEKK